MATSVTVTAGLGGTASVVTGLTFAASASLTGVGIAEVAGGNSASRRTQNEGDKTFKTERVARGEAFRKNNVPTSKANNFTRKKVYGKNKNLRGKNGEPYEVIEIKDVNGRNVNIDHHNNGHQFKDNNTFEHPHYHSKNGNGHYSYPPKKQQ